MRVAVCFILFLSFTGRAACAADIHRCVGESGEVLFSGQPCGLGSTRVVRASDDAPPGTTGLRAGELAWLESRAASRHTARSATRPGDAARQARKAAIQAHRCQRKRHEREAVTAEMRRGYKPARGRKLRRRLRAYEDYLDAFCS
ncbi:MAG: hypothetical protein LJE59_16550 [Chromatiaceae bacterium]|nr:hypothetical protein [Chromatiaceae bacterium]